MSEPAIGVCGFPRCGSSMLMRMLEAGGVPPVVGSQHRSYELPVVSTGTLTAATDDLPGHAVKLLDYPLWFDEWPDVDWRFIWSDRDREEQAKSTVKLMRSVGMQVPRSAWKAFALTYFDDRERALGILRARGPVLVTRFEDRLRDPLAEAWRIADFLDRPFQAFLAAAVVNQGRSSRCAKGIDFELGLVG